MSPAGSSTSGPELHAVPDASESSAEGSTHSRPGNSGSRSAESPGASQDPDEERGRGPWLLVLMLAAIVVLGIGYAVERSRANALEGEVSTLQGELQTARDSLQAAERRMGVVRAHVDDLAGRIGLLQEAVADPVTVSQPSGEQPGGALPGSE